MQSAGNQCRVGFVHPDAACGIIFLVQQVALQMVGMHCELAAVGERAARDNRLVSDPAKWPKSRATLGRGAGRGPAVKTLGDVAIGKGAVCFRGRVLRTGGGHDEQHRQQGRGC